MPYRVFLSPSDRLGLVELSGDVRWSDLASAMRALYRHPAWEVGFFTLWDAHAIASFSVLPTDFPGVREVFEEVADARRGGRTAILARESEQDLWLMFPRMGPSTARPLAIVGRMEEALAFLGLAAIPESMAVVAWGGPT